MVFCGLRGGSFLYLSARIDQTLRSNLFRALIKQEIGFFDLNKTGKFRSTKLKKENLF